MKKTTSIIAASMLFLAFSGCEKEDKAKTATKKPSKLTLKLAHNMREDHLMSVAIEKFANQVKEKTNGEIDINIFPNGVLGTDRETMEQLKNGALDMVRSGSGNLSNFSPAYGAFMAPYLFENSEHFHKVMNGEIAQKIYQLSENDGFIGLTYYDSGARSFYTRDKAINSPEDLKGMKIRTMEDPLSIATLKAFGAAPTPMAFGDVYTALQQGVLDGAENNTLTMSLGKHGEISKFYSFDEHVRMPDILVISNETWNKISDENKNIMREIASSTTKEFHEVWDKELEKSVEEAKKMGVTFIYPDKKLFVDAVKPVYEIIKEDKILNTIVDEIKKGK